jgi:hypothetical protein
LENIDSQVLLKLWKKGKTLYTSLFEFTDNSLRQKYNKSCAELKNQTKTIPEKYPNGVQSISDGIEALSKSFTNYQEIQSANDELKRNLLNNILSERLIGIGFESPIKTTSQPQVIPIHIWPQNITDYDWNESSFSINGVEFLKIRLIKNAEFKSELNLTNEKEEITLPDLEITDKHVGRPSKKKEIIDSYNHLKKENKIDYSKTFKSHTELIRKTVRLHNPKMENDKGLGVEAIRRTVKHLFDQEKKNQK